MFHWSSYHLHLEAYYFFFFLPVKTLPLLFALYSQLLYQELPVALCCKLSALQETDLTVTCVSNSDSLLLFVLYLL